MNETTLTTVEGNATSPAPHTFTPPKTASECVNRASEMINGMMAQMLKYADKKYLARLQSVALSALAANPKLMSALATQAGQTSFAVAVRQAAEMNLLCDGIQAAIVPYKGICKLVVMYQGMVETAFKSKLVKAFHHGKVCANDGFKWENGEIHHTIDFKMADRGKVIGYWVRAVMEGGIHQDNFMTPKEVDAIRARSAGKNEAPWVMHYDQMAYKTVLRNLYKWLPKSEAMDRVVAVSDAEYENEPVPSVPAPTGNNPFISGPVPAPALPEEDGNE